MTGTLFVVAALVLGLAAGVLSGMFGVGGGLLIVPALVIFFHEPPKAAVGTSLFALMWPVGLLGVIEYWRSGQLRPAVGAWIAVGLFIGAYFGAKITLAIPATHMKRLYAVFLLVVGVYFLVTTHDSPKPDAAQPAAAPPSSSAQGQVH